MVSSGLRVDALQIQFDIFSEETLEGFISSVPPQATVSLLLEENKAFPAHLERKAWIQLTGRKNAFLSLSLSLRQWLSLHTKVTHSMLVRGKVQSRGSSRCSSCHLGNLHKHKHQLCRER